MIKHYAISCYLEFNWRIFGNSYKCLFASLADEQINTFVGLYLFILELNWLSERTLDGPQREVKIKASWAHESGDVVAGCHLTEMDDNCLHVEKKRLFSKRQKLFQQTFLLKTLEVKEKHIIWLWDKERSNGTMWSCGVFFFCLFCFSLMGTWRNIAGRLHCVL